MLCDENLKKKSLFHKPQGSIEYILAVVTLTFHIIKIKLGVIVVKESTVCFYY